jgi:hypothetical protein
MSSRAARRTPHAARRTPHAIPLSRRRLSCGSAIKKVVPLTVRATCAELIESITRAVTLRSPP